MLTTAARNTIRPAAIRCFLLQQRAPEHELIIASEDDLELDLELARRVRVVKTAPGLSLPEKRNAAIAAARYSWITFWDDDDWSSQMRLHETMNATHARRKPGQPLVDIVGQPWIYFHELRSERRLTYLYRYPNHDYVVGGPMAFRQDLWA